MNTKEQLLKNAISNITRQDMLMLKDSLGVIEAVDDDEFEELLNGLKPLYDEFGEVAMNFIICHNFLKELDEQCVN